MDSPSRADGETSDAFDDVDGSLADLLRAVARAPARVIPLRGGTEVGSRYVVQRVLGRGGMGVVYLARDTELARDVAIKLHAGVGRFGLRRLEHEARAMAQLNHANVLVVYEVGLHEDELFIAMEYVDGGTAQSWRHEQPRTWREILEVYTQAARGLAAAHGAGLVHRDFKPGNVLIGRDGRVRVADFGLAQVATGDSELGELLVATKLTGVAGTPDYMAPEQFETTSVGPRADQYAWAVTLHEALYGRRPYGERPSNLVADGDRVNVSPRVAPRWLHRIIVRAAALDPDDRYADMNALVIELDAAQRKRRHRWTAAISVLALASAGGLGLAYGDSGATAVCSEPPRPISLQWVPEIRTNLRAAFVRADASFGPTQWAAVASKLETYASEWADAQHDVCVRTRRDGTLSARLHDAALQCLEDRAVRFDALLRALQNADSDAVAGSLMAARALPELGACTDATRLRANAGVLAAAEDVEREVADVRSDLALVWSLYHTGKTDRGASLARQALQRAQAIGYAPLEAAAQIAAVETLPETRREASLVRAYELAYGSHDDPTSVAAALELSGLEHLEPKTRDLWTRLARAGIRRGGTAPAVSTLVEAREARRLEDAGRFDDAVAALERALKRRLALRGEDTGTQEIRIGLAVALELAGRVEESIATYDMVIAQFARDRGPHSAVLPALLSNRAMAHVSVRDYDAAIEDCHLAESILIARGTTNNAVADRIRLHLGIALTEAGRLAEAVEVLRSATEQARARGDDERNLALLQASLGNALERGGEPEKALEAFRGAEAALIEHHGANHREIARAIQGQADALASLRRFDDAVRTFRRGLAMLDALGLDTDPQRLFASNGLGEALLELHDYRGAAEAAAAALAAADAMHDPKPTVVAALRFVLARASVGLGEDPATPRSGLGG